MYNTYKPYIQTNIYIYTAYIHHIHIYINILTVFAVEHLTEISGEYIREYNRHPYPIQIRGHNYDYLREYMHMLY